MIIKTRFDIKEEGRARDVIGKFLSDELYTASELVSIAATTKTSDMSEIIKLYQDNGCKISTQWLTEKNLIRPSPNKIFRRTEQEMKSVLIPSSKAVGIVLEHKLRDRITLDELVRLIG